MKKSTTILLKVSAGTVLTITALAAFGVYKAIQTLGKIAIDLPNDPLLQSLFDNKNNVDEDNN
jgi:hypothetical protein